MTKRIFLIGGSLVFFLFFLTSSCSVFKKKEKYIEKNYEELKKSFPNADVTMLQDSIKVIFPNNLVFDIGQSELKESFSERLGRFSEILKEYKKTNLLITGYTDNLGTADDNLKLSLDRAAQVKKNLQKLGVINKRLYTWGLGETNPIATNQTDEGRAQNRRVEFVVLYKPPTN